MEAYLRYKIYCPGLMTKKIHWHLYIDEDIAREVEQEAVRTGRSRGEVIRRRLRGQTDEIKEIIKSIIEESDYLTRSEAKILYENTIKKVEELVRK